MSKQGKIRRSSFGWRVRRSAGALATMFGVAVGATALGQSLGPCSNPFESFNPFNKDAAIAAGRTQIVAIDHDTVRVTNKCGNTLFTMLMDGTNGFWAVNGPGTGPVAVADPETLYDDSTKRFWISAQAGGSPSNTFYVAYSDPYDGSTLSKWHRFKITLPSGPVPGFPNAPYLQLDNLDFAVDEDSLWFSFSLQQGQGQYDTSHGFARINKAALITFGTVYVAWLEDPNHFLEPLHSLAHNYSFDEHPQYVVGVVPGPSAKLVTYELRFANGQIADIMPTKREIAIAAVPALPALIDQPTSPAAPPVNMVVPTNYRPWNSVYRNGSVWASWMKADASGTRVVIGWGQALAGTTTLVQQGTIDPSTVDPGLSAYSPTIAVDATNNAAVSYCVTGPDATLGQEQYISIWRSSRCAEEPYNQMNTTTVVYQGTGVIGSVQGGQTSIQFGDYAGCEPDPVVPNRFWCHHGLAFSVLKASDPKPTKSYVAKFDGVCGLDFTADGSLNMGDAQAFFDALAVGDPAADLVIDNAIDMADAEAFGEMAQPK